MISAGQLSGSLGSSYPYYFGSTPVYPAVATASPTNAALGVPAGQVGGAGMGIPAGATAAPPSAMAGIGGGISGLAPYIAEYIKAGAVPTQVPTLPQQSLLPISPLEKVVKQIAG